jgi:hypothetical protein
MRIFLFLITMIVPAFALAEIQYTWVELGPKSTSIARAIVSKTESCPTITIDHKNYPMQIRADADANFPIRSCEYKIPKKAKKAVILGKNLVLVPKELKRIVIIGDTGCRLKGLKLQSCNNLKEWPFAQLAQHLADIKPDLVIHTGDYHYRETECPAWKKGCQGSPSGYGWDVWEADFFKPAKPLLANTPWIMVRGNHEECKRAGEGWRRLLDPNPFATTCSDYTEPYAVRLGDQQFLIFDSSKASYVVKKDQQAIYQKQFQAIKTVAINNVPTWLLVHHPVWTFFPTNNILISNTESLQAAIGKSGFPSSVKLVASGHLHLAGWLRFNSERPIQVVVGNGGSKLESHSIDFSSFKGKELDGKIIEEGFSNSQFGYLLATRTDKQWVITLNRLDGSAIKQFEISAQ